jgi:paraquat-inducible protein B
MQLFKKEIPFVMFFDGDIGGLDVGAPLEIRGVKIGAVTRIRLFAENKIGVYVNVDPSLLPKGGAVRRGDLDSVPGMIQRGLRAQLKTQSLLTGQLLVYLDFFPSTPITLVGLDPDVREIPTIPTTLEQLQARVEKFIDKLGTINIDELVKDVSLTLKGARDLMSSPELKAAVVSADTTLKSADTALKSANAAIQDAQVVLKRLDGKLESVGANADAALTDVRALLADAKKSLAKIDAQVEPLAASIRDASASAQGTLRTVDRAVAGESRVGYEALRALRDVADAARSLKALADYLEQHPDALLRGKGGPENK